MSSTVITKLEEKISSLVGDNSWVSDAAVEALDSADELAFLQKEFIYPAAPEGKRPIYLCGNSLGLQPKASKEYAMSALDKWGTEAVHGYFDGEDRWTDSEMRLSPVLEQLLGAESGEVALMNTLSVNLHMMMVSFYRPTETRFKIILEKKAFPSDYHVVTTQLQLHGLRPEDAIIEVIPAEGAMTITHDDILKAIAQAGENLALVLFTGVQYYSGQLFDIQDITRAAHDVGAIAGFDLAHAVGNVPLHLHDWNVDFACFCTYKYLNCGPGALGGIFVNSRYATPKVTIEEGSDFSTVEPLRLGGWWGHRFSDRFVMAPAFHPADGVAGWRISNPSPMTVGIARASFELFAKAGIERIRSKSQLLGVYMVSLLKSELKEEVRVLTPSCPSERGSQLSLSFSVQRDGVDVTADEVLDALTAQGITCDVRKPGVIRFAPTAMFNSFRDVRDAVVILKGILRPTI